ncbi:two-component system sensor histidine kinase QseC [Azomonas agilis]|uniref:histidine kinase n=1 Tax=Azomonas agilis TaxID=116849 RepID=A0A562J077_9GAMM|nr:ATP-binding protein [Azomonas agilis]TWH76224.1 two-component system sensor histidine kinase QseC [Azomonas agilis]
MRSLRTRILLLVLSIFGLFLPIISYKSYYDARHEVEELFDAQLAQSTRLLSGLLHRNMNPSTLRSLQQMLDEAALHHKGQEDLPASTNILLQGHPYETKVGFQVFTQRGRRILHSASIPDDALHVLLESHGLASDIKDPFSHPHLGGYHSLMLGEYLWRLFLLHDHVDDLWILAAERDDVRGELIEKIMRHNLMPDVVGLPLLAIFIWFAVHYGLRPLEYMTQLLKTRAPDNLSPLLISPLPRELEPIAASLNRLLLQVRRLLEREKQFLADAAHELRTPLAVLRIHQQNALAAQTESERMHALRNLGTGVERATRVVSQLLTFARLEPQAIQLNIQRLNALSVTRTELAEITPLALARHQELTLEADETQDYQLFMDAANFSTLLQNLLSNAIQYTPEAGVIQVQLEAHEDYLSLQIQDSGPGVPAAFRDKLFERFFRLGAGQGAGLGLSIVARILELHQGRIELGASCFGGLSVRVELPRHLPAPADATS